VFRKSLSMLLSDLLYDAELEGELATNVWLYRFGSAEPPSPLLLAACADAGMDVDLPLEIPARGPGIVVFDEVTTPLCEAVRAASRSGRERVIALSASPEPWHGRDPWALLEAGASDVVGWDPRAGPPGEELAARLGRWEEVDRLLASATVRDQLVGESLAWRSVLRRIVEVARFTDAPVLVTGESGTGKELVARLIHELDIRRRKGRFVVADCTTVVPSLSGSEFFGHDRGAFTGASSAREGAFALADGGTLFLDEVGELPLTLQAELLRVVQEGTYKRVGSNVWQRTSFRLVCATNRDLPGERREGSFRGDFFFRIAACIAHLPSLRDRREDIVALVEHFFRQLHPARPAPPLDPHVQAYLVERDYPGNIRDLRNVVCRISSRHVGPGPVTIGEIPEEERPAAARGRADWRVGPFEQGVQRALAAGATLEEITAAASDAARRLAFAHEQGSRRRAAHCPGVAGEEVAGVPRAVSGNGKRSTVGHG
jgi:DNA-binding NtrC family response regulator